MPEAVIYLRHGCHLCEAFIDELNALAPRWGLALTAIDIDTDPALRDRYHTRVPVLHIDGQDICEYFVDADRLSAYFESR